MPAPASIDAFLEVVNKSGLVEAERLRQFMQQTGGLSSSPRKLAARLVASGLVTQFQAEQLLLGKHRGFVLGKYKVLERIGSGGHSTVYLCEHVMVKRRVAVKVLPTAKADNPAALARFYREARAAGALDHPNLVKAHDIDRENGLHFLVMDYIEGSSLQQIVSRIGALSPTRAAHYIHQAAQGLQAAHVAGLVHRDIKPANILVDRQGVVRVLDLGLARYMSDVDDPLTLKYDSKNVLGTADYVSPEQALNSHEVDIRADIYSLGATFYFLLSGQPLFPSGTVTQKLISHQTRQPTPLRQLCPEVSEEMAAIVERMIQKDPAARYATPAEVIEALVPWTTEPISPPSEAEMPRLCPAARAALVADTDSGSNIAHGLRPGRSPQLSIPSLEPSQQPAFSAIDAAAPAALAQPRPATPAGLPTPPIPAAQVDTAPVAPTKRATPPVAVPAKAGRSSDTKRHLFTTVLFAATAALTGMGFRWLMDLIRR